tara:strand:+ start:561 stop:1736 length:1176 start_codon:yes stop_codon:yes gene_type:complete
MAIGSGKTVNYGALRRGGTAIEINLNSTNNSDTVVYYINTSYRNESTLNIDFTGPENLFNESNNTVQLDSSGNATVTRTLNQTQAFTDTTISINLRAFDGTLLASGANLDILGNVHDTYVMLGSNAQPLESNIAGGYEIWAETAIGANPSANIISIIGSDPYVWNDWNRSIEAEIVGGGAGRTPGYTRGRPGNGANVNVSIPSMPIPGGTTGETDILGSYTTGGGGIETPGSNTTLTFLATDYVATGGTINTDTNNDYQFNGNIYSEFTGGGKGANQLTVGTNGTVTGPIPDELYVGVVTTQGGNGGDGYLSSLTGLYYGGGGAGFSRQRIQPAGTPDYVMNTLQGTPGLGQVYGYGATSTLSPYMDGGPGAIFIKLSRKVGYYPVFAPVA